MRQTALVRLDGVGERDRLGALRALHLYVAPHVRKSGGPPAASARSLIEGDHETTKATTRLRLFGLEHYARLWHSWLRINRVLRVMLHTRWSAGGVDVEESGSRWLGGCPPRHGFAQSSLSPEQLSFCLSHQHVGSVAQLLAFLHELLRRVPQLLSPES